MPPYPELIEVPGGAFTMGSKKDEPYIRTIETPQHDKVVPAFYLAKYPVTNQEYIVFIAATGHPAPTYWLNGLPPENKLNHPVVSVNFDDATTYCKWLSKEAEHFFRLPSEEEWEKAARGTVDSRIYTWGNEWAPFRCNSKEDGKLETTSVSRYELDQENPYGIADMLGNVWEWTSSIYKAYNKSEYTGNVKRVVRGGSFKHDRTQCRVAYRGRLLPKESKNYIGFRIATDEKPLDFTEYADSNRTKKHEEGTVATSRQIDRATHNRLLRKQMKLSFSLDEINTLIFDLGLNKDDFPELLSPRIEELIKVCERQNLPLLKQVQITRPNDDWNFGEIV